MKVNTLQSWTNKLVSLPRKWQGLKKNVMQTKLRGAFLVIVHNGSKCGSHMWLWQRNFYQTKIGFCDSPAHRKTFSHSGGGGGGGGAEKKIDQKTAAPSVEFYVQVLDLSIWWKCTKHHSSSFHSHNNFCLQWVFMYCKNATPLLFTEHRWFQKQDKNSQTWWFTDNSKT